MIFFKNTHLLFYLFIIFSSFQEIPKSEISIVWYGESTTQGAHVSKDKPWNSFMWRVSDFFKKKLKVKTINKNLGFPGWSAKKALINIEVLLKEKLDYVFLEFALNDTNIDSEQIIVNLKQIVKQIKNKNKDVKICLILLNKVEGLQKRKNNKIDSTSESWIKAGKELNIQLIDVGNYLLKLSKDKELFNAIIPDGVHPNDMGHFIYSTIIINELLDKNFFQEEIN
jgi:lysophospholipase L1-like esterase